LDDPRENSNGASTRDRQEERLDSWKKIASYLKRDVSTVQRWERREGMPVHRHLHDKLGSVFAFRSELDRWWESRRTRLAPEGAPEGEPRTQAAPVLARPEARSVRAPSSVIRAALAAAVVLLAGAAAWLATQSDYFWRNPLAPARFIRLADFGGAEQAAAISRDGRLVAFLADRNGRMDAWVSEIGSGSYRNLTDGTVRELVNPSIRTLGFSPDSSLITVWTRLPDGSRPGDVSILAVPTGGGTLRPYLREAAEYDWSHDGKWLVYHTTSPGDPLFVRGSGGEGGRQVYVAPAGVHCHFPIWSPDDAFIYFVRGVPPDNWDVWRIRPSGAGLERITRHNTRVAYPVMLDRRTLVYLATDADGSGPWLYGVDVERRITHRISSGLESYTSLGASADGARLVATVANPRTSLWRMSLSEGGAAGKVSGPTPVLADGATPRFGPGFVLFVSPRGQRQGIWALSHDTTRELWSSTHARLVGAPAVSPDGHHIAFTIDEEGRTRLCMVDNDGTNLRTLADSLLLRGSPAWAPDGQSVVSAALRDGEPHLTRIFLNGDAPALLVSEYSLDPVWSPDGQFLVYSGADVGTTFPLRAAAADGRPHPLHSVMLTRGARRVAFLRGQQALVFLRGEIGHKDLWLIDLQSGGERLLAQLPKDFVTRDFDVSADGSEIVLDRVQENSALALIERKQ
jgi:Tol biopolymer transport system component